MSSVVISGDTSGAITLAAPAIAGTNTLSLPAVTDTLVGLAATQTLTNKSIAATQLTGTIAAARLPTGSVLQVVSTTKVDVTSSTSATYADITGMSVSITPTSATSKILVMFSANTSDSAGTNNTLLRLVRNSTNLAVGTEGISNNGTNFIRVPDNLTVYCACMNFLDSPATTSSTTYKLQWVVPTGTIYLNRRGTDTNFGTSSTITVMEIAA
jgi:hypothetical protein